MKYINKIILISSFLLSININAFETANYKTAAGYINNYCASGTYDTSSGKCVTVSGSTLTTDQYYTWSCSSGRMTANCENNPPATGITDPTPPVTPVTPPVITIDPPVCNTSGSENSCNNGIANTFTENLDFWFWKCDNAVQESVDCSKNKPVVEPAPVCSTTVNVCDSGSFTDIADNATHNLWTCSNSTETANCSKLKPVVTPAAECSLNLNSCNFGSVSNIATQTNQFTWRCTSGSDIKNCSKDRPAVCSTTTENNCSRGSVINATQTSTAWNWTCQNGTESTNCSKTKPVVTPQCGSTNTCAVGTVSGISSTTTKNLWSCNAGTNTVSCNSDRAAICSTTTENSCVVGSVINTSQTSTAWTWTCQNGTESTNCSKTKPPATVINGQCTYKNRNSGLTTTTPNGSSACVTGNMINRSYSPRVGSTRAYWSWSCEGIDGGTTDFGCERGQAGL